jgi:hypothetical protein
MMHDVKGELCGERIGWEEGLGMKERGEKIRKSRFSCNAWKIL